MYDWPPDLYSPREFFLLRIGGTSRSAPLIPRSARGQRSIYIWENPEYSSSSTSASHGTDSSRPSWKICSARPDRWCGWKATMSSIAYVYVERRIRPLNIFFAEADATQKYARCRKGSVLNIDLNRFRRHN